MGNHRSRTVPVFRMSGVALGLLGLLSGCPTVDLGDTPSDIGLCNPPAGMQYFQDKVWPEFVRPTDMNKGCIKGTSCHSDTGGNALSFKSNPVDYAFNYRQTQIYLNCGTPMASELLSKPLSGMDPHGGGDLFAPGDPGVQVFLDWFK